MFRQWTHLVHDLEERGYLEHLTGKDCVDDPQPTVERLEAQIDQRLGIPNLWPLRPGTKWEPGWDQDTFYGLVEVVHDLVARPRSRRWHSWSQCGWHYSDYAARPGRALYRWQVNQLFARHGLGLRLAEDGEDTGRLVHVAGDDRDELVWRALATPATPDRSEVEHAVALYRARGATREDKRGAVLDLVRVLEHRRTLLKTELLSKDEGALFTIANQFDIRHRRVDQRPDYVEAYLDWVFWWYLATLELTDQLLARQEVGT